MNTFNPDEQGDELFEFDFFPKDVPTPEVLARIAQIIHEEANAALATPPELVPPDPDAAPTTLTDAVAQAEDVILRLAAEPPRPPVTSVRVSSWRRVLSAVRRLFGRHGFTPTVESVNFARQQAAETALRRTVENLNTIGIELSAEALVETPVAADTGNG